MEASYNLLGLAIFSCKIVNYEQFLSSFLCFSLNTVIV